MNDNEQIQPEVYAVICPNCNGRGTVGYDAHACPTCGDTNHKGVIYAPIKLKDIDGR